MGTIGLEGDIEEQVKEEISRREHQKNTNDDQ